MYDIIFVNIIIVLITYFSIQQFYQKNDRQYYNCSKKTHVFGLIFPILNIIFINILYFRQQISLNNKELYIISLVCLMLSYGMLHFHLFYQFDSTNNVTK